MNREELTRAIGEIEQSGLYGNQVHQKTLETALTALRSELDRVGCEYCNDGEAMAYGQDSLRRAGYIYLDGNLLTADLYSDSMAVAVCYCPMCGKKLEVEHE